MDKLLLQKHSTWQRIQLFEEIPTGRITLALNNFVQFLEGDDERAYHEALVAPVKAELKGKARLAVLGGGDGLAARELLKLGLELDIMLVDIDREVVQLCRSHPRIRRINQESLDKIKIVICDAKVWVLAQRQNSFDAVIADFPDPTTEELKKLFNPHFFKDIRRILKNGGIFTIQAGSNWIETYFNCQSIFWNVAKIDYLMPNLGKGQIIWARKDG